MSSPFWGGAEGWRNCLKSCLPTNKPFSTKTNPFSRNIDEISLQWRDIPRITGEIPRYPLWLNYERRYNSHIRIRRIIRGKRMLGDWEGLTGGDGTGVAGSEAVGRVGAGLSTI